MLERIGAEKKPIGPRFGLYFCCFITDMDKGATDQAVIGDLKCSGPHFKEVFFSY